MLAAVHIQSQKNASPICSNPVYYKVLVLFPLIIRVSLVSLCLVSISGDILIYFILKYIMF